MYMATKNQSEGKKKKQTKLHNTMKNENKDTPQQA